MPSHASHAVTILKALAPSESLGATSELCFLCAVAMGLTPLVTMQAHMQANPKGKHGKHQYDLESFGLDAARVRERFADYVDRFQVKTS